MNVLKSSALETCGIYDLLLLSLWASSLLYYAHAYVLPVLVSKSNGDWFSSSISLPPVFFQTAMDEETLATIQKCFVTWCKLTSTQKYLLPITRIKHVTLPFSQYIPSTFFYFKLTQKPEDYQPYPYFTSARDMSISCLLPDTWGLSCL